MAIMSRNSAEFLALYFACAKIGVVCVPCNLLWKKKEFEYVLAHSRVRGICVQPEFVVQVEAARPALPALSDVLILPGANEDKLESDEGLRYLSVLSDEIGRAHV